VEQTSGRSSEKNPKGIAERGWRPWFNGKEQVRAQGIKGFFNKWLFLGCHDAPLAFSVESYPNISVTLIPQKGFVSPAGPFLPPQAPGWPYYGPLPPFAINITPEGPTLALRGKSHLSPEQNHINL